METYEITFLNPKDELCNVLVNATDARSARDTFEHSNAGAIVIDIQWKDLDGTDTDQETENDTQD